MVDFYFYLKDFVSKNHVVKKNKEIIKQYL